MSVTPDQPYGVPAEPVQFVATVNLGTVRAPIQLQAALASALHRYAADGRREWTPFDQQPGFARGDIHDDRGMVVGHWEVKGLTP